MTPRVIVPPEVEPISVDEARAHLEAARYDDSDIDGFDDAMIEGWIGAAREYCEGYLGLSLATKTLEIALNNFPCHSPTSIDLPMGPVRQVLSVNWGDDSSASSEGELNDADFLLDTYTSPARITPYSSWPYVTTATNAVRIRYVAGYGVDSEGGEPLPKSIRAAIFLILGHLYANRENTSDKALSAIPNGAESLMQFHRVRLGMA